MIPTEMTSQDMYEQAVLWGTGQRSWTNMMPAVYDDPGAAVARTAQADAASAQGWLAAAQAQERLEAIAQDHYDRNATLGRPSA